MRTRMTTRMTMTMRMRMMMSMDMSSWTSLLLPDCKMTNDYDECDGKIMNAADGDNCCCFEYEIM